MNADAFLKGTTSFAESFIPFLITGVSVLMGLFLIYSAIKGIYQKGSPRQSSQEMSFGNIAFKLLVGGLCLRLGPLMQDMSSLLFGGEIQDYRAVLAYMPMPEKADAWKAVFEVCLLWVVMLGWAGAFRGLMLWNKASDGGGGGGNAGDLFWQGTWHLIGAAAAINMAGFIESFFGK